MAKHSDTLRHPRARLAGAVAFAMVCAGAWIAAPGAASAQNPPAAAGGGDSTDDPGGFSIAPEAESGAGAGVEATAPETDAARLDALFAELATAEADAQAQIVKKIQVIWSRSGSASMDLLLRRGRDALNAGEMVKAIGFFSALVEHDPEFAEGWNARATAYYMHGDWGLSLADIEQVLAREPRHFGALTGLGMILEQIGRDGDAIAAFRAALAVNPHIQRAKNAVERLAPRVEGRDI